ncbi:MAG: peroxiredoxin [Acidobacteriota bacterium]
MIDVGDAAPDFELSSQAGQRVRLSDYRGKKCVVLYFYPKDYTPVCTAESCAFRDAYEDFKDAGAEVIGISSDSERSHRRFAADNRLPFILLSDEGSKVRELYGVPATLGLLPGRVTYVIDKQGTVRMVFSSQLHYQRHVDEALELVRSLATAWK